MPHSCFVSFLDFVSLVLPGLHHLPFLSSSLAWGCPELTLSPNAGGPMSPLEGASPLKAYFYTITHVSPKPPWRMVKVTDLNNFQKIHQHEFESSQGANLLIWGAFYFTSALPLVLQNTPAAKGAKTKMPTNLSGE